MAILHRRIDVRAIPDSGTNLLLGLALFIGLKVGQALAGRLAGFGSEVDCGSEAVTNLGIHVVMLAAVVVIVARTRGVLVGWRWRISRSDIPGILAWWLVITLLGLPSILEQVKNGRFFVYPDYLEFYLSCLVLNVFVLPLTEEYLFRGILFAGLNRWRYPLAHLGSIGLYVLWHVSFTSLLRQGTLELTLYHALVLVVTGHATTRLYDRCGNLVVPFILHAAYNLAFEIPSPLGYLLVVWTS